MGEVGYARTTIKEVCTRAGLSQGGLFRHFATRLDLIVAAADAVAIRHAQAFVEELQGRDGDPLEAALRAARARCHSPLNSVWHELMLASRTDSALCQAVEPAVERHRESISALAEGVIGGQLPPERAQAAIYLVLHCFDGEAMHVNVLSHAQSEEQRFQWVLATLRAVLAEPLAGGV